MQFNLLTVSALGLLGSVSAMPHNMARGSAPSDSGKSSSGSGNFAGGASTGNENNGGPLDSPQSGLINLINLPVKDNFNNDNIETTIFPDSNIKILSREAEAQLIGPVLNDNNILGCGINVNGLLSGGSSSCNTVSGHSSGVISSGSGDATNGDITNNNEPASSDPETEQETTPDTKSRSSPEYTPPSSFEPTTTTAYGYGYTSSSTTPAAGSYTPAKNDPGYSGYASYSYSTTTTSDPETYTTA